MTAEIVDVSPETLGKLRASSQDPRNSGLGAATSGGAELEVIIPTWNVERQIQEMLGAVICRLAPLGTISGIAVVDSGSSDRTLEVVDRFATTSVVPVRLVGCSAPGWPAAALRGVRTSQARWVGFAGSHDTLPAALGHAIALLRQGYHIVIGEPARPAAAGRRGPGKLRLTRFRGRRVPTRSGRSRSIGVCDRAVADLILEDLAPHWSGSDIELLDDGRYLGLRTAEIGAADPDREGWWPH